MKFRWFIAFFLIIILSGCSSAVREIIPQQIQDGDERVSRGNTYLGNGYFEDAGISFMQAYKDYSLADDIRGCAASLTGLGVSMFKQGRAEEGMLFLGKAESYYISLGKREELDEFYTTMAFLFIEQEKIEKAEAYVAKVNNSLQKRVVFARCLILVKKGKAMDALALIKEGGGDSSSLNDYILGLIYLNLKQFDKAETYFRLALEKDKKNGSTLKIAGDLESLYLVELSKKNTDLSKNYLLRAIKIYSMIKNRKKLGKLLENLKSLNGGKDTEVDRYFMNLWLND